MNVSDFDLFRLGFRPSSSHTVGAAKAIDASRLALLGDGQHSASLDKVIATMKRTDQDMSHIYKEPSLGGLAVNPAEC